MNAISNLKLTMFWPSMLLLSLLKLGHTTDSEYPDIEDLFSVTSNSREVMESARKSGIKPQLSLNLENIRNLLAQDKRSTDADKTYYSRLKKLQRDIENTRKSEVKNFALDVERMDINRVQKKLQNLESAINNEKLSLEDTRKQILYPPIFSPEYYYDSDTMYREHKEFSDASQYVMKTKLMDMMLQLIFMARHKIKFLEKINEFSNEDHSSFKMAFLFSKMSLIRRNFRRILSTCRLKHDSVNERDENPFDFVEIYLILHHKAVKLYVDFVYLYGLALKIHEKQQEKHGKTLPLTVPEYYNATAHMRTATTKKK